MGFALRPFPLLVLLHGHALRGPGALEEAAGKGRGADLPTPQDGAAGEIGTGALHACHTGEVQDGGHGLSLPPYYIR